MPYRLSIDQEMEQDIWQIIEEADKKRKAKEKKEERTICGIHLTGNEVKMIQNIGANELNQNGSPSDPIYSDNLKYGPNGQWLPQSSFGGILSSLSKKELVWTGFSNRESLVALTEKGTEVFNQI
jgi:hypothetical protein